MAPREGDVHMCPRGGSTSSSAFWTRLHTLPVIQSTIQTTLDIYSTSKEKPILGTGLGVLEYGVNLASSPVKKVASTIVDKYPVASSTAHKLDKLALNCLDTLEHKIPAIQKSPTQIVTNVKKGASSAIHTGVRRVMKTYPGQKVVKSIDSMIMWSETTIHSSDAEGCDEDGQKYSVLTVKLRNGAVVPVKLYLHMLKMMKHMLANMAGVKTRATAASPRKASMGTRRLVAPKKRLPERSLVSMLTSTAMSMLGLKKSTDEDVAQRMRRAGSESPDQHGCRYSEKRKHDEEEDEDSASETESMNLASALDHYDSEVDSDYCPGDDPNDDSLEYNSGDTESDLETEEAGINKKGEPLCQLKTKAALSHMETGPSGETH